MPVRMDPPRSAAPRSTVFPSKEKGTLASPPSRTAAWTRPPRRACPSRTKTRCPERRSWRAAASPAIPAPTTTTEPRQPPCGGLSPPGKEAPAGASREVSSTPSLMPLAAAEAEAEAFFARADDDEGLFRSSSSSRFVATPAAAVLPFTAPSTPKLMNP